MSIPENRITVLPSNCVKRAEKLFDVYAKVAIKFEEALNSESKDKKINDDLIKLTEELRRDHPYLGWMKDTLSRETINKAMRDGFLESINGIILSEYDDCIYIGISQYFGKEEIQ